MNQASIWTTTAQRTAVLVSDYRELNINYPSGSNWRESSRRLIKVLSLKLTSR